MSQQHKQGDQNAHGVKSASAGSVRGNEENPQFNENKIEKSFAQFLFFFFFFEHEQIIFGDTFFLCHQWQGQE